MASPYLEQPIRPIEVAIVLVHAERAYRDAIAASASLPPSKRLAAARAANALRRQVYDDLAPC